MVDRSELKEALPHYLAVMLVMLLALMLTRAIAGNVGFLVEIVVVIVVSSAYFFVVRELGLAPKLWQ